ncbi:MAG: sigma-70 family RNA polymerase sigma factor [Christensenellaceae bacterium]|nr:sigma-70 family RNA polymerase sigma factor [Christensenellaceae bacterium]
MESGYDSFREQTLILMVNEHQTALKNLCYMMLHDEALAEDAVQETFIKAYKGLASFRGDCGEKTWLTRIAVNTCRDMQRSGWFRHVDRRVSPDMMPDEASSPDGTSEELAEAIVALPVKYREVVLLRYYQDMTIREIAQALGIAQSSVFSRLKRAEKKLRITLEGRDFE